MDAPLHILTVNGTQLSYTEHGNGEPVLFIHGSLGDYRNWNAQIEPFSSTYRVIALNRRGHYPRPWRNERRPYSARLHAEDIIAFIRGIDVGPVHAVAASYGAYSTLHAAAMETACFRSLTLGEPPIMPWLEKTEEGRREYDRFAKQAWEPAKRYFEQNDLENGVRHFIKGVTGRDTFASMPEQARQGLMDNALEMQAEALSDEIFPPFDEAKLDTIAIPVLLLTGEYSPRFFTLITDELQRRFPHAQRAVIPKASHSLQTGNPEFYNVTVLEFLETAKNEA